MAKYAAYGCVLALDAAPYAGVTNISGPSMSLDTVDVTSHDSTGAWEEVVAGILRSGEITLDLVYDPANATHDASTGIIAKMVARTVDAYTLTFSDVGTTTWTFNAFVTAFEPSAPVDGALTATATMKLTGQPTLA